MSTGNGAVLGDWQSGSWVSCCSPAGQMGRHNVKWNSDGWTGEWKGTLIALLSEIERL